LKKFQKSEEYKTNKNFETKIFPTTVKKGITHEVINVVNVSNNIPNSENQKILMPDLRGQTVRDALIKLNLLGLKYDMNGSGMLYRKASNPARK